MKMTSSADGQMGQVLNLPLFDRKLESVSLRARDYPPTFHPPNFFPLGTNNLKILWVSLLSVTNPHERNDVEALVRFLTQVIENNRPLFESSGAMALRAARVYTMACNLDLPQAFFQEEPNRTALEAGSLTVDAMRQGPNSGNDLPRPLPYPKALPYYELALQFDPRSVDGHWYYGMFLCSSMVDAYGMVRGCVAHLEQAVRLGSVPARYSLALAYHASGDVRRAIAAMEQYLVAVPADALARNILEALRGVPGKTLESITQVGPPKGKRENR